MFVCLSNNCKMYKRLLVKFPVNVDNGQRNRWLHFGNAPKFQISKAKIKGAGALLIKQSTMLCNLVLLQPSYIRYLLAEVCALSAFVLFEIKWRLFLEPIVRYCFWYIKAQELVASSGEYFNLLKVFPQTYRNCLGYNKNSALAFEI